MLELSHIESEYEDFDSVEQSQSNNKPQHIEDGELYEQALGFVIKNRKISINQLRKAFKVGFTRAKKVVEQLEKNNIIESYSGGGSSRVIKVPKEQLESHKEKSQSSFHYVNHILKIPSEITVVEEDDL